MNRDQILALEGLKLRKAVAKARGWEIKEVTWSLGTYFEYGPLGRPHRIATTKDEVSMDLPSFESDMGTAWLLVEELRDLWTEATKNVPPGADTIPNKPFEDGVFFEYLKRKVDRRWPWALLYITPADICRGYLLAKGVWTDDQPHD